MWIFLLIVLAVVIYFVLSQASNSNQASKASSRTQASKESSQNYTNQVDYSNLEVSLDSDIPVDYTRLRDLLAEGKWKEADKETGSLMLTVGYRTAQKKIRDGEWTHTDPTSNRLDFLHFFYFPCRDLFTIDRLWLKYSNGRFGFSIQKRIMSEIREDALSFVCEFPLSHEGKKKDELLKIFEKRIGWYTPDREDSAGRLTLHLKTYNDLTFSMQAPHGHLPTANYCPEGYNYFERDGESFETKRLFGCSFLVHLLNRLSSCGIAL